MNDCLAQQRRVGSYWSCMHAPKDPYHTVCHWWDCPLIVRHVNKRICGTPHEAISRGVIERAQQLVSRSLPFSHGISVGCGTGQKEMELLRQGFVQEFDLFELAQGAIDQGKEIAQQAGLADRVRFHLCNPLGDLRRTGSVDLVHWNNSLHHMADTDYAVWWSRELLRPGGLFYLDDFVGPTRFQWSHQMLEVANRVRAALPDRYLRFPAPRKRSLLLILKMLIRKLIGKAQYYSRTVDKPSIEDLIRIDPSEAADSSRILESVRKHFPTAEITLTGGVIYHLALHNLLGNFDEKKDGHLLNLLMVIDDLCTAQGETHYAVALAVKGIAAAEGQPR